MQKQCALRDPEPIAALGVLSAAGYAQRRSIVRSTWFQFSEVACGLLLTRFVVAKPWAAQTTAARAAHADAVSVDTALRQEVLAHNDTVVLVTNATGRAIGPLHTTYRWFCFAISIPGSTLSSQL